MHRCIYQKCTKSNQYTWDLLYINKFLTHFFLTKIVSWNCPPFFLSLSKQPRKSRFLPLSAMACSTSALKTICSSPVKVATPAIPTKSLLPFKLKNPLSLTQNSRLLTKAASFNNLSELKRSFSCKSHAAPADESRPSTWSILFFLKKFFYTKKLFLSWVSDDPFGLLFLVLLQPKFKSYLCMRSMREIVEALLISAWARKLSILSVILCLLAIR